MFSIPSLDRLSTKELQDYSFEWFEELGRPHTDPVAIDQAYHLVLPRNIFFKSLPEQSEILDVGAGDGAVAIQKRWPLFGREDLRLYALSLEVGAHFDLYESYEIKNFETDPDVFSGRSFDAILCAHFIEHLKDPDSAIQFFSRKLRPGGRVYIEWPHAFTKNLPTKSALAERGIKVSTFNFFDDLTHVDPWPADQIIGLFEKNGFAVETGGRIYLPWIGARMRDHARSEDGDTRMSLGAWAAFGWAQYLVANRV
jgi:SAM-dependent methyltransferase